MEQNEISMSLDVKLDIHDKRPESLKFKAWTRCEVKIEAIKCLPCFLRINFLRQVDVVPSKKTAKELSDQQSLSVSINVPGVSISLATSRTKQYSYGLFWTQNRRACFIYFALETEASCRRHMKWIKKSIKNLELHRQLFLEQRRNSRGPWRFGADSGVAQQRQVGVAAGEEANSAADGKAKTREMSSIRAALGPLPQIPIFSNANNSLAWASRISRVSDIYEEIFEGTPTHSTAEPPRLSRRFSRSSIASGIYEEMKPTNINNFNAIVEEITSELNAAQPPPLPPLPPPRKRINTFETEALAGLLGDIPRSLTNPESELVKKKKYRNVLENIFFGSGRGKRAGSVSEPHASSVEDLIAGNRRDEKPLPIYANEDVWAPKQIDKLTHSQVSNINKNKRNSFSSPDLSKINLLDTFDDDNIADLIHPFYFSDGTELDLSNDSDILSMPNADVAMAEYYDRRRRKAESLESLNFSQHLPSNFNFSAVNCSTMNLLGASGAVPLPTTTLQKNKILVDDLSGYCLMAPIVKKTSVESTTTSGYATGGSHCSSTSSCNTNSQEDAVKPPTASIGEVELRKSTMPPRSTASATVIKEESVIYENMNGSNNTSRPTVTTCSTPPSIAATSVNFTDNLYDNLLAVKAAQELGSTATPSTSTLSTSTPTDSPHALTASPAIVLTAGETEGEESYYQTPRKSIISVDDKISSYYPNSCDTVKVRRQSTALPDTPISSTNEKLNAPSIGLRHLVNMKMRRERKENLYISSPQKIIEQRQNPTVSSSAPSSSLHKSTKSTHHKSKKTAAAHKISENVYTVTHANKKSSIITASSTNNNNNNQIAGCSDKEMKDKLQTELQLAMLQNIDFKFDDTKTIAHEQIIPTKKTTETTAAVPSQHHLQLNQAANTSKAPATSTGTAATATMTQSSVAGDGDLQLSSGIRKFASLPRFKKIDFSPLKLKINNVLQRNQHHEF